MREKTGVRVLVFVLVMGIVAAMVPQKVLAEDRAIAVVPQVYEANLILNGLDGKTENSWYSMLKSFREPLYYELTDYLLENKTLTWSSNFWNAAFNDQFRKNPSYFYEVMLMGFLKYEQKQVSMDGVWNSKEMSCALSIYKNLVDEYTDTYEGAALEEYIKKCNKLTPEEAVKEISKITDIRIGAEAISTLKKGCANGKELIDAVAEYQTLLDAKEERIALLKLARQNVKDNEYFTKAIDDIVNKMQATPMEYMVGKSIESLWDKFMDSSWDLIVKGSPIEPILKAIDIEKMGLDLMFNSSDTASNNFKLLVLYIMDTYFKGAMDLSEKNYKNSKTVENANAFIECYQAYIDYQVYGLEYTKTFIDGIVDSGPLHSLIEQIFFRESIESAKELKENCDGQIQVRKSLLGLRQRVSDLYNAQYGLKKLSEAVQEADTIIPVTSISFSKSQVNLKHTNDLFVVNANVYPANATNQKVTYKSSDSSILSVPADGGFATIKKAGKVTITATAADGGYTAAQTVTIGEESGLNEVDGGKCGENVIWKLYSDGTLYISGTGEMYDYPQSRSWYSKKNNIKDVILGEAITSIGYGAFTDCKGLINVTISNSISSIGYEAFQNCSSLANVTIPNSVTIIGESAFYCCSSLVNVIIPNSVTCIKENAFGGCSGLTGVTIPKSVTWIEENAFCRCSSLTSITIPDSVTWIRNGAFRGCSSLTNVAIPNSVTTIGDNVFRGCSSLTNVTISNSVRSIGYWAFKDCSSLTNITIPNSVTKIGGFAFYGCRSLSKVIMKGNAPETGLNVFHWCTAIRAICVPENSTGYDRGPWTDYKIVYDGTSVMFYKVTYNANGGKNAPSAQKKTKNKTIALSKTKPTRTGYTFQGWSTSKTATKASCQPGSSYKTNKNLNLYAVWKANAYKIAFNKNGGSGSMSTVSRTYDKASALPSNAFKRSGYKFKGWNTKSNGTGTSYADKASVKNLTSTSGKTVTLYAQWVKGRKLTYNANGGKVSTTSKTVYQGSAYGTLATPTRTGYTFAGWYTAKSGGSKVTSSTKVTKSSGHTLYAHWTKTKYTIKYVLSGGKNNTGNPSGYYASSSTITLKNPARTGYTFAGWYTSSSYKTKATQIAKGSTGNKSFYAKWSANTYTIRYHRNGGTSGSMADTKSCKYGETYTLRANAYKRPGYKFSGWASTASGTVVYKDKASVKNLTGTNKAVKTLYAKWTPNTYRISYHLNGGKNSSGNPYSYKISTSTITLKNPTRTGYTFKGWYADSSYKKKIATVPKGSTGTKNLYARWSANVYTIRYDKNGATSGSMTDTSGCKYGQAYTLRENVLKKTGYTFEGWAIGASEPVVYSDKARVKNLTDSNGGTVTMYAKWSINTYQVQFDGNGASSGSVETISCEYGKDYTLPGNSYQRTGWIFSGWNTKKDGSGTGYENAASIKNLAVQNGAKITMYAQWKVVPTAISLPEYEKALNVGETYQLSPVVESAEPVEVRINYSSDNEQIAVVDANGLVTALAPGDVTIFCKTTDGTELNTSMQIHVITPEVLPESISMREEATLQCTEAMHLSYTVWPENTSDKSIMWRSSDESIVVVDENGWIYGINPGTAVVTATANNGIQTSCLINVEHSYFTLVKKVGDQFIPVDAATPQGVTVNTVDCDMYLQVTIDNELVSGSKLGIYILSDGHDEYAYTEIDWEKNFERRGLQWYFPLSNSFEGQVGNVHVYYDFILANRQMTHTAELQGGPCYYLNFQ